MLIGFKFSRGLIADHDDGYLVDEENQCSIPRWLIKFGLGRGERGDVAEGAAHKAACISKTKSDRSLFDIQNYSEKYATQ